MAPNVSPTNHEILPTPLSTDQEAYKTAIENLASIGDSAVFDNASPAHAAIVIGNIFQKSEDSVKIFAGDFNGAVSNYDYYLDSLKDFLDKKRPLTIIFENEPCESNSLALKMIRDYKKGNKEIKIKKLREHKLVPKSHFAISDGKMFRLETSKDDYKALCSFNSPQLVKSLENIFYNLESVSEDI